MRASTSLFVTLSDHLMSRMRRMQRISFAYGIITYMAKLIDSDWMTATQVFLFLFIYLASPGFLAGMPQQREPITAVP